MRRFLTLVFMVCLAVPAGISISGCTRNPAGNYCYGLGYGLKNTDVASITLQPQTTGISLAYGQTQQITTPSAYTCTGSGATVNSNGYVYGTSNNKLLDISPAGTLCAGTWNRNTGGGIPDYTYCNFPSPLPSTGNLPYTVVYITASIGSVTSNPVAVYLHQQVSSISLVGPSQCESQNATATLDAQACYSSGGKQYLLCAPSSITSGPASGLACPIQTDANGTPLIAQSAVPACTSAIGYLSYSVGTSSIGTINTNNNVITANQPGTTAITATLAGTSASAGYFSTCPPQSINVTLANGNTSGTVTQGTTQNLTTTVKDENNVTITGMSLDYQSTNPIDITVGATGGITANYPGVASIYAVCQPGTCNSSPLNELGLNGTGLPLASNPVNITTPGTISDYAWFAAPGASQYVVSYSVVIGALSSTVRLPYVPNSMVMDRTGTNLIFGSQHELMIYSTINNTLTTQNASVPGVVLAVSPNDSQVLINDQVRQLFYLFNVSGGSSTTFSGLGNAAAWTPDSKTLYITDNAALNNPPYVTGHTNTLYVYNANTGWSTYSLPADTLLPLSAGSIPPATLNGTTLTPNESVSPTQQTPAITIPGVGAYLRGDTTVAHTWCPVGTVSPTAGATITGYYPGPELGAGDSQAVHSDVLAATTDGNHILGAAVTSTNAVTLSDINISLPTLTGTNTPVACQVSTNSTTGVQTLSPLAFGHTGPAYTQSTMNVKATALTQLVASPVSNLAFVLYQGSSANAQLPYYVPGASGAAGTVGYVPLSGASSITSPVAGAFTSDDALFFVSTTGDNKIHIISIPSNPAATVPSDTQQLSPNLPACTPVALGGLDAGCVYPGTGTVVPATAIAVIPRSTT